MINIETQFILGKSAYYFDSEDPFLVKGGTVIRLFVSVEPLDDSFERIHYVNSYEIYNDNTRERVIKKEREMFATRELAKKSIDDTVQLYREKYL